MPGAKIQVINFGGLGYIGSATDRDFLKKGGVEFRRGGAVFYKNGVGHRGKKKTAHQTQSPKRGDYLHHGDADIERDFLSIP